MKTLNLLLLAVAFTAVTASIADAHTARPRVDRRQAAQHLRIRDGVRSGQLTTGERSRLRAGQSRVRRLERLALRDGAISRAERRHIERAQDRQSRRIARMKHDRRSI